MIFVYGILVLIGAFILLIGAKIYKTQAYIWLPFHIKRKLEGSEKPDSNQPIDILFFFTDHFEPETDAEMDNWLENYPKSVANHLDSDGRHPQHGFFYPWDNVKWLKAISSLVYDGYGELEFHLHHGKDNSQTLTEKIEYYKDLFSKAGGLITAEKTPQPAYAFIHGMWSLDNSRGFEHCGVNNEITILKQTGCFADYTMPSHHETQAKTVNSIYYVTDDPEKPKSYDTGVPVEVNKEPTGDLMMVEGPSALAGFPLPRIENGSIETYFIPTKQRVDTWIKANVHVKGQPNWVFVKTHTHAADFKTAKIVLGETMQEIHQYLEENYNDGKQYRLHYVTAREVYNIIKAAEQGKKGNPNDYRDYIIKPYVNQKLRINNLYKVHTYSPEETRLEILENAPSLVEFKDFKLKKISGSITELTYSDTDRKIALKLRQPGEKVTLVFEKSENSVEAENYQDMNHTEENNLVTLNVTFKDTAARVQF